MTFIVGLAGPGKVGKSTTAKLAIESFNKNFPKLKVIRYAFASPIYDMASYLTGWTVEKLKDLKYKEVEWTVETAPIPCLVGYSPRTFLQKIGTECFRNIIHSNFWIDVTLSKVKEYDVAIIEDARFENEFKICDMVIELQRSGIEYAGNHASAMPPDPKYISAKVKIDDPNFSVDAGVMAIVQEIITKKSKI
jgi:hypothetical protein